MEKSGWPKWVKTEADKQKFIRDYEVNEGIHLDPNEIEKNEGLRQLAKLMLNSFWGKVSISSLLIFHFTEHKKLFDKFMKKFF